ncbi:MAG TPA: PEP-CTERM sorting domain-containing protein [Alphaproteobacteria bacterium]|nr:PEP-CTERM sorting domain-containing protein [Alphaproteobacteria bacterium]
MPGILRAVLPLLIAVIIGQAAIPAAALPLRPAAGLERIGPSGLLMHASTTDPLSLLGSDSITTIEGPQLDNVPEPDTLAILGGAIAAFAVVALIRRNRPRK